MSHADLTPEEEALLTSEPESDDTQPLTATEHTDLPVDAADAPRQLEVIESFHQDLACRFEDALCRGLQRIVEIRLVEVQSMTYSQFAFSRSNPTCFVVIQAKPLPANLALDFHPGVLYPILDCLLGGGKRPCPPPDRPPTELESRLARRVAQLLLDELHDMWERVLAVDLSVDQVESHAQRVRLVAPSERVVTLAFQTRVAEQSGVFTLCLPLRAIRKIVDKLLAGELQRAEAVPRQTGEPRERQQAVSDTTPLGEAVELTVQVELAHLAAAQLEQLQVGDVLRTDVNSDGLVEISLDGKPTFLGRLGTIDGQRAVELQQSVEEE